MYEDLIKRLREKANEQCFIGCFGKCRSCEIEVVLCQAADAIEELSRDLDSMNDANIALYGALPKWIPVTERLPEPNMRDWKSCENCKDQVCYHIMQTQGFSDAPCRDWEPMRCRCNGALSTTRHDKDGKPYRHCYSCHMEFYEDVK